MALFSTKIVGFIIHTQTAHLLSFVCNVNYCKCNLCIQGHRILTIFILFDFHFKFIFFFFVSRLHHDQQTAHALESAAAYSSYPTMAGKLNYILLMPFIKNVFRLFCVCFF